MTEPVFQLGREFDKGNKFMKIGRNRVINDYIRVSTKANQKMAAMLVAILFILQSPYSNFGENLVK